MPESKSIVCCDSAFGSAKALAESTQADSGIVFSEVSVSCPPIVIPHKPRLIEYAEPCLSTVEKEVFDIDREAAIGSEIKAKKE